MATFHNSPRRIKAGNVVYDAETASVQRIVALSYALDTLARSLQVKGVGKDICDHWEALRLKLLPKESIELDAETHARKGRNP